MAAPGAEERPATHIAKARKDVAPFTECALLVVQIYLVLCRPTPLFVILKIALAAHELARVRTPWLGCAHHTRMQPAVSCVLPLRSRWSEDCVA